MAKTKKNSVTFEEFERSVSQGSFQPIYLFTGEEDFLVEEAVELLVNAAVEESARSFNLDIFYGAESDAKHIVSIASAYPMMTERRAVVVREFDKLGEKEVFLPYLEQPSPSTCLVLISDKPDFRQKVYKVIQEHGIVNEFRQLYEDKIPGWVSRRIQKFGKEATPEACQLMLSYVGTSLREIQNEIDKLFIYVGDKKSIDVDDVNAVVGMTKQFNIFELQRAVGKQNLPQSMEILEHMLEAGEYPVGIIVMLTKYFQKLWVLRELRQKTSPSGQSAAQLNISPFFMEEYLDAARKYSDEHIERCFKTLTEADEALKTSAADHKIIMTVLVYKLIRGTNSELQH